MTPSKPKCQKSVFQLLASLIPSHRQTRGSQTKSTSSINQNAGQGHVWPYLIHRGSRFLKGRGKTVEYPAWTLNNLFLRQLPACFLMLPWLSPKYQLTLKTLISHSLKIRMNHLASFFGGNGGRGGVRKGAGNGGGKALTGFMCQFSKVIFLLKF